MDRPFYLAAFFKDKSLAVPMEAIWKDTRLLPDYCLYSCPIVFALTVYATSDLWTPPDNMNKSLLRHYDLYPEIHRASEISLEPTPQERRAQGLDRYMDQTARESERELIEQAGPVTQEYLKRFAAACQLEYSVCRSKNLNDLYWLAIQEIGDAAFEFRGAVYTTIYRAEKARRRGQ